AKDAGGTADEIKLRIDWYSAWLACYRPDEIAQALRALYPELTKKRVYRAAERGLRWLRDHADLYGHFGVD
ncbi:MAG: hypothetical protein N2688_08780, partial [Burkholderiaceae bacterium]|nr:hypothetical protein [Burkholderiaceae bacterium]